MEVQASASAPPPVVVNAEYCKEIERARRYLRALISSRNCAPMMLRLAFHDAGTYDAAKKTGGPNGSIRNPEELNHSGNRGLKTAVDLCEEAKKKHPSITYADLYQLAGVVAVEVTGGPTIRFVPGRQDSLNSPEEGRLPDANEGADHLRSVFNRMGLEDRDIVALSGAHTLGGAHKHISGFDGKWTEEPWKFDNSYFKELLKSSTKSPKRSNPPTGDSQQKPSSSAAGEDSTRRPSLFIFSTDHALIRDPKFLGYVTLYAEDEEAFFRDYAASHKKLSELGFVPPTWASRIRDPKFLGYVTLYAEDEEAFFRDYAASHKKLSELGFVPPTWASRIITAVKNNSTMAATAAGVVFAATAITFFYRQRSQEIHVRSS